MILLFTYCVTRRSYFAERFKDFVFNVEVLELSAIGN